jgi:uracil-DNA glycosylase family 4
MDELQVLEAEVRSCTRCRLSETRKRAVPGEGDRQAKIMFVGEGPGFWENEQGRPFVGQAGKLLEDLLARINLRRDQVYITNVVKCRPPNNRDPQPDELAACHGYLERQIALFEPRLIVTLGRFSMAKFFPPGKPVRDLHGTTVMHGRSTCLAMYHPAAALRQPSWMQALIADFETIPALLERAEQAFAVVEPPPATTVPAGPPEQLSLF